MATVAEEETRQSVITYFNISGGLEYENNLLKQWGLSQRIVIREATTATQHDDDFIDAVRGSDGVVTEYFTITDNVMDHLPTLKVIGLQSIGTDMVDKPAATRHGIAVTNSPGFCQEEVATTAVGMIIDLARNITFYDRDVRAGAWEPLDGPMPHRLRGRTVGLVFFGGIPRLMAPVLKSLGMNVIAFAPTKTAEILAAAGVDKVDTLDELLEQSDFVSLHTPLIKETHHLISERELSLMRPGAFLINTARGGVVDEQALVAALKEGRIAGAAVDVIEDEDSEQSELKGLSNVVINPHAAFLSQESFYQAREMTLRGMVDLLIEDKPPRYLVNHDWLDAHTKKQS
ncbi:C-terminal binding protein [Bifidobacterium subtile]|jgi:D-3-phosphoglycerate dehydrogenase|uniref:Hydroxyacid dehydrogenase n=1 Tax=Bifidobacterium subtile TaxID=77635 RepID=A0A087EAI4_9BIFI|nr:C-terminal binding protein [Bifidobacterium subtile]KFJ04785.1 hydroxyacid dehydrogenase [Bifidobacterium subtile]QOL35859.1 C-terminal binding protein [Bifidobacterium subtile]